MLILCLRYLRFFGSMPVQVVSVCTLLLSENMWDKYVSSNDDATHETLGRVSKSRQAIGVSTMSMDLFNV